VRPPSGLMTPYTFDFTLAPQIVSSSLTAAGGFILTTNQSGQLSPIKAITQFGSACASTLAFGNNYSDVGFSCAHTLSDLANQSAWTAMYDAYRINHVTVIVEYLNSASQAVAGGIQPTVFLYADQDDFAAVPVQTTLYGKQGAIQWTPTSGDMVKAFRYVPRVQTAVQAGSGGTSQVVMKVEPGGQWLNCTDPTVLHKALKFVATDMYCPGTATVTTGFRIQFKYNISFRSPLLCD